MKKLDLDTVGGRIRKTRQDAKLSMQAFAEKINITGNYVGLIERGDREPSSALLRRISSAMGVSYGWLAKGAPLWLEDVEIGVRKDATDAESDPAQAVNPQLYLSIVLLMAHNISKDTLVTILGVPSETIDGLLAGKPYEYDPHWGNAYSVLARSLDLRTLRRDLRNLDIFLEREETVKHNTAMIRALRQYAETSAKHKYKIHSINDQSPDAIPSHVLYTDIIFSSEEFPYTWYFKCFPERNDIGYFHPSDVIDDAVALSERLDCRVTIVLTSKAEFKRMDYYFSQIKRMHRFEIPGYSLPPFPSGSAVYYDFETEEVAGQLEFDVKDDVEDDYPDI